MTHLLEGIEKKEKILLLYNKARVKRFFFIVHFVFCFPLCRPPYNFFSFMAIIILFKKEFQCSKEKKEKHPGICHISLLYISKKPLENNV